MHPISKRSLIMGTIASSLWAIPLYGCASKFEDDFAAKIQEIENTHGGRLGVSLLNTQNGKTLNYRGGERFALCSTFKLPLAAIILRQIEQGKLDAAEEIPIVQNGLYAHSQLVRDKLAYGKMRIIDLAREIQITSDNIAANALIKKIGGPEVFTKTMQELGDNITNITRYEPSMNLVEKGAINDTTSPNAMSQTIKKILFDSFLSPVSIQTLADWMIETKTGSKRLRAGLPKEWRAGDKTGTGINEGVPNRYNDVAVIWPTNKAPHIISCYYEGPGYFENIRDIDQEAIAKVGRAASLMIG